MRTAPVSVDQVVGGLERDGYAVVPGLFSPEEVAAARSDLGRVLEATPEGRNDFEGHRTRRVYALFAKTRAFDGAVTHPLVLGVADRLLGHCQLSAPTGIEIGPGEVAQVLHFDDSIYPVPRPHDELVLNTMWALDDFVEANGATLIVPGSHRWVAERPSGSTPTIAAEMPAGSVLFYGGSLWHGGGAAASWLRQQENHILAVPRELARTLSPRLQELLGYNIRPPFIGYVDGRHPRRALEDRGA